MFIIINIPPEAEAELLRQFAQFSRKIPLLPDEAFARENLYGDHP